jgi:hypothetical protein
MEEAVARVESWRMVTGEGKIKRLKTRAEQSSFLDSNGRRRRRANWRTALEKREGKKAGVICIENSLWP